MIFIINELKYKIFNHEIYTTYIEHKKIEYNEFDSSYLAKQIKSNIININKIKKLFLKDIIITVINTNNTDQYKIYVYHTKTKNTERYIGNYYYHTSYPTWIGERHEESDNIDHNNYKFGDYIEFYYNNHKLKGYIVATEAGLYQHHYGNKNIYEVMYKKCFKWHYIVDDKFIHYDDIIRYIKNDTELVKNKILNNSFFSEEYLEEIKNL